MYSMPKGGAAPTIFFVSSIGSSRFGPGFMKENFIFFPVTSLHSPVEGI